jgi:hypothetical protein
MIFIDETKCEYIETSPENSIEIIKTDKGPENEIRKEFTQSEKENISKLNDFVHRIIEEV